MAKRKEELRVIDCWTKYPDGKVIHELKKVNKKQYEAWKQEFEEVWKKSGGVTKQYFISNKDRFGY